MTFDDVIVVEITIVTSHLQRGVSHDVLKGECIAAAVHQILASKSVPERMDGSPLHTSAVVVLHDDPIAILAELTIGFRLLQKRHEFIIGVGFFHCFRSLVDFEIGFCVALFVTPREENLQCSSVTVD